MRTLLAKFGRRFILDNLWLLALKIDQPELKRWWKALLGRITQVNTFMEYELGDPRSQPLYLKWLLSTIKVVSKFQFLGVVTRSHPLLLVLTDFHCRLQLSSKYTNTIEINPHFKSCHSQNLFSISLQTVFNINRHKAEILVVGILGVCFWLESTSFLFPFLIMWLE